jgi:hypothetical protein
MWFGEAVGKAVEERDLRKFVVEGEQHSWCMWRSTGLPDK